MLSRQRIHSQSTATTTTTTTALDELHVPKLETTVTAKKRELEEHLKQGDEADTAMDERIRSTSQLTTIE
jgi:hypothetical protein